MPPDIPHDDFVQTLLLASSEHDLATADHSTRTGELAVALGRACRLHSKELRRIRRAAALHDIGKLGVSPHILHKPTALDADEWAVMRTHAARGSDLVRRIDHEDAPELALVARHHHEAFDGTGYPDGLSGDAIPLPARIVALADAYDAIASPRAYHPGRTHKAVMAILEGESIGKFDPYLHRTFVRLIASSPLRAPDTLH